MKKLLFLTILVGLMSCKTMVNPNEWVVSTGTCWNTMTVSKAGDYVPRLYTTCDRMIILPATFMSMEFITESKFKGRVAGSISVAGQWRIVNPIAFIQNAKSITSAATDDSHKIDVNVLEEIENGVVDKMLMDLLREYTPNEEPGIDELTVEQQLSKLAQSKLLERGVEFANMSANITFTEQTEEALDAISALKFYRANSEEEFGRQIILNKALAPKISVSQGKSE